MISQRQPSPPSASVRGQRHKPRFALRPISLAACLLGAAPASFGLPQGATANGGQASVSLVSPTQMQITQSTPRAGLDWTSFSIAAGERVNITQPTARSVLVNRVLGNDPSQIHGALSSNGQVWLVNPRGIYFGAGSQVDVGGLVATTLALGHHDIDSGRLQLGSANADAGELRAEGSITAIDGSVLLVAPRLLQSGRVQARRVGLAAASEVLVDVEGDGLIFFNARNDRLDARLSVLGEVLADGGTAEVRAAARAGFADTVLNLEGVVRARSLGVREGRIVIDGGAQGVTRVAGEVDARGAAHGERGGDVQVLGRSVLIDSTAAIDASGSAGGGRVRVGGDYQGRNPALPNAAHTAVQAGASIAADATEAGDGGRVIVWADKTTQYRGTISARGGPQGGDGGFVEVSGKQALQFDGSVSTAAPRGRQGTLLLDPNDLCIVVTAPSGGACAAATEDTSNPFASATGNDDSFVRKSVIEGLANTALQLTADNDIIFQTSLALAGNTSGGVTLSASNTITMAGNDLSTVGGAITMNAGAGGITGLGTIDTGGGTFTVNSVGAVAQNTGDTITGTTSLVKQGAGTLTLSQANTYTGTTTVSLGTLALGADNVLANAGTLVVSGGVLDIGTRSDTVALVRLTGGSITGTTGVLTSTAAFDLQSGSASAILGGTAGANKTTAGSVSLSGANTYTGTTTVSAGTLALGNDNVLANTGTLVAAGGVFDIGTRSDTVALVQLQGGSITGSTGVLTSSAAFDLQSGSASAILGGTAGASKTTVGSVSLSGVNTYTGTTTVSAGTLALGNDNVLANGSTLVAAGGVFDIGTRSDTVAQVRLQGGSITGTSGVLTSTAAFDLQSGSASAILGGTAGANKTTADSVTLSGVNTYTGTTTLSLGTLALGANNVLANGGTLVVAGGVFDIGTRTDTVAQLRLQGGSITGSTGVLTSTAAFDLQSGSASAILAGTAGASKSTTGSVTLSGANTYTGSTTVSAGTLVLGHAQAAGGTSISVSSGATLQIDNVDIGAAALSIAGSGVANAGALQASGAGAALSGAITLTGNASIGGSGTLAYSGTLSGNFDLDKVGAGTLNVSDSLAHTGTTTVTQGTLALGNNNVLANTGTLIVAGGTFDIGNRNDTVGLVRLQSGSITGSGGRLTSTAAFDLQSGTVSAGLAGNDGVNKTTAGTVTLSADNNLSGTTTVSAGTLVLGHAQAAGNTSISVSSGATLQIDNVDIGAAALSIAGSGVANAGALQASGAGAALSGAITLTGNASIGGSGTLAYSGTLSGSFNLDKVGAGTLNVSDSLAHTGTTTVTQGLLALGNNNVLADAGTLIVAGGTLDIGTRTDTVGLVRLQGGSITGSSGVLTSTAAFDLQAGSASAILAGSAGADKTTAGTVTLSGANTYTGTTTVSLGTLALGASNVLADAGTLVVAGGVFDIGTRDDTVALVRLQSGSITGTTGVLTSTAAFDLQSGSVSARLGGTAGAAKTTTNSVTLSGANTYSGTTTVSAGTLVLGHAQAAGSTSISVASGATLQIDNVDIGAAALSITGSGVANAGALQASGAGAALSGAITLTGNASIGGSGTLAYSGTLSGNFNLDKVGAGTLNVSDSLAHTGTTTVTQGLLALGNNNVLADAGTLIVAGGTFDIGNRTDTVGLVRLQSGTITGTTGVLTSTGAFDLQSGSVSAILAGSAGADKTTAGTVTLSGANTYTGTTTVSLGTLVLGASNVLADAGTLVVAGGVFDIGTRDDTVALVRLQSGSITGTTGVLTSTAAFDLQSGSVSARLGGTAGAAKTTTNSVTLSGANTYSGTTTVSAGTLVLGHAQAAGAASIDVASGATLEIDNVDIGAVTLGIAGNGVAGGGALQGSGANAALGGAVTLAGNTRIGGSGTLAFNATLAGNFNLEKVGTGTLNVNNTLAHSGTTTVTQGTIALGANDVLADAGTLTVAGGIVDVGTRSDTVAQVRLQSGSITGTTGVLTSTAAFDLQSGSVSARLGGTAGAAKTTTNSVTLSGANTYSGTTTVSAGTLVLGHAQAVANSPVDVASGATLQIDNVDIGAVTLGIAGTGVAGGGALQGSGANAAIGGAVTLAGNTSIGGSGTLAFNATLGGNFSLDKVGAGTLIVNNTLAHTGTTTVTQGTLALGADNVLPDAGTVVAAGGVFGIGTRSDTVGLVRLQGGTITGSSGVLTSTAAFDLQSGSASAVLGGSAGASKTTAGTVTLSGANTYTGTTTVNQGLLALGASNVLANGSNLLVAGGVFDIGAHSDTVALVSLQGGTITGTTGVLTSTAAFDLQSGSASAILGGSAGANKTTAGSVTLSGANTYTGTSLVSAGTLALGANNVLADTSLLAVAGGVFDVGTRSETVAAVQLQGGSITGTSGVLSSTAAFDLQSGTASAILGGSAGANKTTAGSVTLSGANTYSGSTTVSEGVLALGANNVLADTGTLVAAGGVFDIGTRSDTLALVRLQGGSITGTSGVLTSTAAFDLQSGTASAILGGSAGANKTTAGSVTLSAANTYGGTTTVSQGLLALDADNVLADAIQLAVTGGVFDIGTRSDTVAQVRLQGGTITGSSGVLTSTAAFDLQSGSASAILGGSAGASKTSAGTVTLSGANTYGGTTTVSQGLLALGADNVLPDTSTLAVTGGTFDIGTRSDSVALVRLQGGTISGSTGVLTSTAAFDLQSGSATAVLGGSAGANKTTAGTVTLSGANSYGGDTTVSAGTLALGADNVLPDGGTLVVTGGVFDIGTRSDTVALLRLQGGTVSGSTGVLTSTAAFDLQSGSASAILSGNAGANKTTTGTVTLSGANTYGGSTTVSAGTLALGADDVLPDATTLVATGGTVDIGARSDTVALVQLQGGTISGSSGVLTSTAAFDLQSGSASAMLGGSAGANKTGAGTVTLSGANTYTGTTTVSLGVLALGADNVLADAGTLVVAGGSVDIGTRSDTLALVRLQGGTITGSTGVLTSTGAFDLQSGSATAVLGGSAGANKTGAGTVTLSGANTYGGTTTVSDGTLLLGADNVLADASLLAVAGGVLDIGTRSDSVALVRLQGGTITGTSGVLTSAAAFELQSGSASAVLGGSAGANKTTAGSVTLSGANTYGGTTTVGDGTLLLGANDVLADASQLVAAGGVFDIGTRSDTVALVSLQGGTVTGSTGVLTSTAAFDLQSGTASAILGGSAGANKTTAGSVTLSAANTYGGTTTVSQGTLALGADNVLADASQLAVTGGVFDIGTRSDTVAQVRLQGGTITGSSGVLTSTAAFDLQSGGASAILGGSAGASKTTAGTVTLSGANSYGGTTTVSAGTLALGADNVLHDASLLAVTGGVFHIGTHNDSVALAQLQGGSITGTSGVLTSTAAFDLQSGSASAMLGGSAGAHKTTAGTVTLSGANTYGGSTTVSAGTLALGADNVLPDSTTLVAAGGVIDIGSRSDTVALLQLQGGTVGGSSGVLTSTAAFDLQSGSASAVLSGNAGAHKTTAGTVTLSGANTYGGSTTISAGTLALGADNVLPDSTTLVAAGGTFDVGTRSDTVALVQLQGGTITGSSGVLTSTAAFDLQAGSASAVLGGSAGASKTTAGTVTLSGANTYTGTTTVNQGLLALGASNVLANGSQLLVAGGVFDIGAHNDTVALVSLQGGTITGTTGVLTSTAAFDLQSGSASAILGGSAGAHKTTAGSVTLSGANTYTGSTTISGGTLSFATSDVLGDTSIIEVLGGTLDIAARNETVAELRVQNGTVTGTSGVLTAGAYTLTDARIDALLGSGSLVSDGNTTLNANAAVQNVEIVGGTLSLTLPQMLTASPQVQVTAGTLALAADQTIGTLSGAGAVNLGAFTLATGSGGSSTYGGVVSGSGTLLKQGVATTFTLAGDNEHAQTRVAEGTLALAGPRNLANTSQVRVERAASLQLSDSETIGRLVLLGSLTLAATPAAGTTLTAADYLLDGGTVHAPLGSGALVSTGASSLHADVAAGSVAVDSGSLTLHRAQQLAAALPSVNVAAGAVLTLAQDQTVGLLSGAGDVALGGFTLATGAAASSSFAGRLDGSGTLQKQGSSTTFTLTGNTTHARTHVVAGTLQLSESGHLVDTAEVRVDQGAVLRLAADETIARLALAGRLEAGAASTTLHAERYELDGGSVDSALGSGTLTSTGTSTLNATTAASAVTVSAGQLTLAAPQRLTGQPLLTVEPGAVLQFDGSDTAGRLVLRGQLTGSGLLTAADYALEGGRADARLGAGALTSSGSSRLAAEAAVGTVQVLSGTLELATPQQLSALPAVTVERDATVRLAADQAFGTLAGAGQVELQGFTLASGTGGASTFDGVISGDGGLIKRGASVFTLRGTNSYRGRTTIEEGTLRVGNDDAAGTLGSGDVLFGGNLATLSFARTDTVTLDQALAGGGHLQQDGSGGLILAGNNKTHTGATRVNRGLLATEAADNLSDGSAVSVAAGARLAIGGNETVQSLDLDAAGELSLAGNLQAAGDLLLRGAVSVPGNQAIMLSGARIDAVNPGNRWGAALGFEARDRITLGSGLDGAGLRPLTLAAFSAAAGGRIDAGNITIGANGSVSGGQLVIASDTAQAAAPVNDIPAGKLVQSRPVAYTADAIVQGADSRLEVGADAELSLLTPNGASIHVGRLDNQFSGRVSAIAGSPTAAWAINDGSGRALQNRVRLGGDTVKVGGAGVIADVVEINADQLATLGDAAIVARLPFDRDVGTTVSLPALTLILTPRSFTLTFPYGNVGVEGLHVNVGSRSWGPRATGPDAGYITVLPRGGGTSGNTSVLLVGPNVNAGGYGFFFDGASVQGEVPVYYNGVLPATPQVENSISATVAVSEAARKQRFDEAVRTENVALRLRAGVIAEVGPAPSATQGPEGARLPATCPPAAALSCAAQP